MTSLTDIAKSVLLQRGKPIHYYIDAMIAAVNCLRQLSNDEIAFVNTRLVYADDNGSITLPAGFQDIVSLGGAYGQYTGNYSPNSSINSLPNYSGGQTVRYDTQGDGYYYGNYYCSPFSGGYKVIVEGNRIQMDESIVNAPYILVYTCDGMNADSASRIHTYAVDSVKAYIEWQMDFKGRTRTVGEDKFNSELKKLRARKNDLTPELLKSLIYKNALSRW